MKIDMFMELQYCLDEQGYTKDIEALSKLDYSGIFVAREFIIMLTEIGIILNDEIDSSFHGNKDEGGKK